MELKQIVFLFFFALLLQANFVSSRTNSITLGIGSSVDMDERDSDNGTEDYQKISVSPLFHFQSLGQKDDFQLYIKPSFKNDLESSESDWDANVFVEGNKKISKSWSLGVSNLFVRSDYYGEAVQGGSPQGDTETANLSPDEGRRRYVKNTAKINSQHVYGDKKKISINFEYSLLRNKESATRNYDDFDRYSLAIEQDHRVNVFSSVGYGLEYVYGDFEPTNREIAVRDDDAEEDVQEYRGSMFVAVHPDKKNDVIIDYNFNVFTYDTGSNDSSINNVQLQWKNHCSKRVNTTLGAGVSYIAEENEDAIWGGNGLGGVEYLSKKGSVLFSIEKRYDVENFSGSDQQELLDIWDISVRAKHRLTKKLNTSAKLFYTYEDHDFNSASNSGYTSELFGGDLGFELQFAQYLYASLHYYYLQKESDYKEDEYDEHRVLFSLNWRKEVARW